jgi:hypothetical protein
MVPNWPLTTTDDGFFSSAGLVRQTGSYPIERAIAVASSAALLAGVLVVGVGLTGALAMWVHPGAAGVVFLALALGVALVLMPWIDERLWAMRAAFAWLVTEVLLGRAAEHGSPSEAARTFLAGRFGEAGAVVETHNQVISLIRNFFRTFDKLDGLLPIDLGQVRQALAWLTDRIAPRIADLALSFAIARGDADLGPAAQDAVTYVAQNPRAVLGAAIKAWLVERVLGAIVGLTFATIAAGLTFLVANGLAADAAASAGVAAEGATTMGLFAAIFAAIFVGLPVGALAAWFVGAAFIEPVALTMLLVRFHTVVQGQPVDPAMRARIDAASGDLKTANRILGLAT